MLRDVTTTERIVLLKIADYANDSGGGAYPKIDTIALETSLKNSGVRKALASLKTKTETRASYLKIESGRGKSSSMYTLTLPEHLVKLWDRQHPNYFRGKQSSKIYKNHLDQFLDSVEEEIVEVPEVMKA